MDTDKIREFIKGIELFSTLEDDELGLLLDKVEVKNLDRGDVLIRENHPRWKVYFIYEGKVVLFKTTPYGDEKKIGVFTKSDFLGEAALFEDSPHSASARAEEKTTVISIKKEKFFSLFENNGLISIEKHTLFYM